MEEGEGRFEFPWNKAQRRNFILKILWCDRMGYPYLCNLSSFAVIPFLSNTPVQFSLRERAGLRIHVVFYSVTENLIISLSLSFRIVVLLFLLSRVKLKTPKCCFQADPWELHAGFVRNTAGVRMKERHSEGINSDPLLFYFPWSFTEVCVLNIVSYTKPHEVRKH